MRNFCAALVATSLMIVPVASADPLTTGPQALAPGKPAGVRAAQSDDNMPLIYFGVIAVGIGVALAVAGNNGSGTPAPSSTVVAPTTT